MVSNDYMGSFPNVYYLEKINLKGRISVHPSSEDEGSSISYHLLFTLGV